MKAEGIGEIVWVKDAKHPWRFAVTWRNNNIGLVSNTSTGCTVHYPKAGRTVQKKFFNEYGGSYAQLEVSEFLLANWKMERGEAK